MTNLYKTSSDTESYIVGRAFKNTSQYREYLDRALFRAIDTQTVFCPRCGTFEVFSKDYESSTLQFCPKCGSYSAFFAWVSPSLKAEKSIDVLINQDYKDTSKVVLMLTSIAKSRSVTINWYYRDGKFVRKLV